MSFPPNGNPILTAYRVPYTDFGHFININHAVDLNSVVTVFKEAAHVYIACGVLLGILLGKILFIILTEPKK